MAVTASEIDAYVGQRMRQRREALGVSQGRLGRHLGLTFSQVQKIREGDEPHRRRPALPSRRLPRRSGAADFFEGLADSPVTKGVNGGAGVKGVELAVLDDAFMAIADGDTRQSVLALVRSLGAAAEPTGRPRQTAG